MPLYFFWHSMNNYLSLAFPSAGQYSNLPCEVQWYIAKCVLSVRHTENNLDASPDGWSLILKHSSAGAHKCINAAINYYFHQMIDYCSIKCQSVFKVDIFLFAKYIQFGCITKRQIFTLGCYRLLLHMWKLYKVF